jgi:Domain of unknown function (DUF6456)
MPRSYSQRGSRPDADDASNATPAAAHSEPKVNLDESPLAWLARRKDKDGCPLLSADELAAGEKLRADFWFAKMTPHVTSNWSPMPSGGAGRRSAPGHGADLTDHVLAARDRVRSALHAVGPDFADILIDVCCHLKGIEQAERAARLPQRAGKVVLILALRQLARHYGFVDSHNRRHSSRAGASHWGMPDYKPKLHLDEGTANDEASAR